MEKVVKAGGAGIVFFSIVLGAFVAPYVDQTTFALLGGTFIGLLVAVPTVLLVVLIAHRRRDERSHREQPPTPTQTHIVERQIVVLVPAGARRWQQLDAIMLATGATRHTAERYLLTGAVKVVES